MIKTHVKAGDEVVVISGAASGKRGRVLQVLKDKSRVILEALDEDIEGKRWINPIKKHQKKTQDNPEGAILEREAPLHISNVMLKQKWDNSKRGKAAAAESADK